MRAAGMIVFALFVESRGIRAFSTGMERAQNDTVGIAPKSIKGPLRGAMVHVMQSVQAEFESESVSLDEAQKALKMKDKQLQLAHDETAKVRQEVSKLRADYSTEAGVVAEKDKIVAKKDKVIGELSLRLRDASVHLMQTSKDVQDLDTQKYKLAVMVSNAQEKVAVSDSAALKAKVASDRAVSSLSEKFESELKVARSQDVADTGALRQLRNQLGHDNTLLAQDNKTIAGSQQLTAAEAKQLQVMHASLAQASAELNFTKVAEAKFVAQDKFAEKQLESYKTQARSLQLRIKKLQERKIIHQVNDVVNEVAFAAMADIA